MAVIVLTPSNSGIFRSIRPTWGRSRRNNSTASRPFFASATMVMPGSVPIMAATPCRTTAWSSAIRTRIGSSRSILPPLLARRGEPPGHLHARSAARLARHDQFRLSAPLRLLQRDDPAPQRRHYRVRLVARSQLLPRPAQTVPHLARRPLQQWGDLRVRLAGSEEAQTRQLVVRQWHPRPVALALRGDGGRDPGGPGGDGSDRRLQLLRRHIARDRARGARRQRPAQVVAGLVGTHHNNARGRALAADPRDRL